MQYSNLLTSRQHSSKNLHYQVVTLNTKRQQGVPYT